MDTIAAFLEDFYTSAYIADMDTYELIYMNKAARKQFNLSSHDDYKGKRCHAVLQGLSSPCPFCTSVYLHERQHYEWDYFNPITQTAFHLRDYYFCYNGRNYRVEIAEEASYSADPSQVILPPDAFINRCLMEANSAPDPKSSLHLFLKYLGIQLSCSRAYLYELTAQDCLNNTYSWSADSVCSSAGPIMLNSNPKLHEWYVHLIQNETILFSDCTPFKKDAELTAMLGLADVETLVLSPIMHGSKNIGILRLDNPSSQYLHALPGIIKVLSHFISSLLSRRDLIVHLEMLSYHDQMTGALNRHSLNEYISHLPCRDIRSIGLLYCDVIGLKRINDKLGHANGDRLIQQIYSILEHHFAHEYIYRLGGDEFLIICENVSKKDLLVKADSIRTQATISNCGLSVGYSWSDSPQTDFASLLKQADDSMYADKRRFYSKAYKRSLDQNTSLDHQDYLQAGNEIPATRSSFQFFLDNYYFDTGAFFCSITAPDAPFYVYCGDLMHNVYFISNNLKDDFGFPDNLVYDFITMLESRIYEPDQVLHVADTQSMLSEKRTAHSIRYRIYDKDGNLVWIHCRGIMTWNEDKSKPLFFSGSMTSLQNGASVDPVTNLLNLPHCLTELSDLCDHFGQLLLLCFTFPNFDSINLAFGRPVGDQILKEICSKIESALGPAFRLFRLDGLHFLAVSSVESAVEPPANTIHQIVSDTYQQHDVHILYPCALSVLRYPQDGANAQDLINNALIITKVAKKHPSLPYVEFSSHLSQSHRSQVDIRLALNRSVNDGFSGFRVVIQPQVEAKSGRIFGGEILLRWRYHDHDVPPSKFIPILEQLGLIIPVGNWIVDEVMRCLKPILQYIPDFNLSFNVSYFQIIQEGFFDCIYNAMQRYSVSGENLSIELTETHFDELPEYLETFIRKCREQKISFILDDFGTAYSSLHLLMHYPADLIKLDRSLLQEVVSSPDKLKFIMSIIYACHQFGKKVCVEGVENESELAVIQQTDCDFIQGYYFHRPMELEQFYKLLEK